MNNQHILHKNKCKYYCVFQRMNLYKKIYIHYPPVLLIVE